MGSGEPLRSVHRMRQASACPAPAKPVMTRMPGIGDGTAFRTKLCFMKKLPFSMLLGSLAACLGAGASFGLFLLGHFAIGSGIIAPALIVCAYPLYFIGSMAASMAMVLAGYKLFARDLNWFAILGCIAVATSTLVPLPPLGNKAVLKGLERRVSPEIASRLENYLQANLVKAIEGKEVLDLVNDVPEWIDQVIPADGRSVVIFNGRSPALRIMTGGAVFRMGIGVFNAEVDDPWLPPLSARATVRPVTAKTFVFAD